MGIDEGLNASAKSGVKWNFASQGGQQATQLLTMVILARLLAPSDFGLLGMATLVIGFVNLFKDLGTSSAVIQSRDASEDLLSSVFWVNVGFGALASLVLLATSSGIAAFYHQPRLIAILRVLALNFVISGLSILQQALFERKLQFKILARVEMTGVMVGAVVGVGSAFAGAGVWALVAQSISSTASISLLLWYFSDWRPRLIFHRGEINRVRNYSLNLLGFNVFNYFARNADYLLIGKFLGATPLGIYTLAYRMMLYPLQSITTVISRVMFPVYSKLQNDDASFRVVYLRTASTIAFVTFPLMVGLFATADPFIRSVFGANWIPVIPLILILAPVGLGQSVEATVGAIYQAKGRTDTMFFWGVSAGLLSIGAFVIGLHWGVLGVTIAYAVWSAVILVPCLVIPFRFIDLPLEAFARALMRPLAASLLMGAGVMLLHLAVGGLPQFVLFPVLVGAGALFYVLASWMINRSQINEIVGLLK